MLNPAQRSAVLDVLRDVQTQEQVCAHFDIDAAQYRSWEQSLLLGKLTPDGGHLASAALHDRASIVRDRWGVAHCRGDSVADLCFAAGVAQAQDRLWQLDYRRRLASGRLAQILGAGHVPTDRENRTLGFRRIVETHELPTLGTEAQEALTGFAAGVNAWTDVVADNLLSLGIPG